MKTVLRTVRTCAPLLLALVLVLVAASCDNPVGGEGHAHPAGVQVLLGGAVVAETHGDHVHGTITVRAGEETPHLEVRFVDEAENVIPVGSGFYLDAAVADGAVARFEQDRPGEFGGHVHGEGVGETTLRFRLMHGKVGSGHADYVAPALPVKVVQ